MSDTGKKQKSDAPTQSAPASPDVPTLFTSLGALRENFDRFFDTMSRGWPGLSGPLRETGGAPFAYSPFGSFPKVDTAEDEKQYEISIELPGVDEKDITLSIEGGALTVKGEKKSEREEKKRDYHLTERSYGSFQRSFRLPENVDQNGIEADFARGVLRIMLPKLAPTRAAGKTIEIKSR